MTEMEAGHPMITDDIRGIFQLISHLFNINNRLPKPPATLSVTCVEEVVTDNRIIWLKIGTSITTGMTPRIVNTDYKL